MAKCDYGSWLELELLRVEKVEDTGEQPDESLWEERSELISNSEGEAEGCPHQDCPIRTWVEAY